MTLQTEMYISKDFVKRRPHIFYLMKMTGANSAAVVATYNTKKKTITLKEDAFDLCSVAESFVRIAKEEGAE
jgi:hypothetical protein